MTRTEQLARALQKRDAAQYGPLINGVQHPRWDDLSPVVHEQYLADAKFAVAALTVIDRMQADLDDDAEAKAIARAAEYDAPSACD